MASLVRGMRSYTLVSNIATRQVNAEHDKQRASAREGCIGRRSMSLRLAVLVVFLVLSSWARSEGVVSAKVQTSFQARWATYCASGGTVGSTAQSMLGIIQSRQGQCFYSGSTMALYLVKGPDRQMDSNGYLGCGAGGPVHFTWLWEYYVWSPSCPELGGPDVLLYNFSVTAFDSSVCPANSFALPNQPCRCRQGFKPNLTADECVRIVTDPDVDKKVCPIAFGNPIHPTKGTKHESVALDLRVGDVAVALTYDTGRRAPRNVADTDLPESETRSFGELWSSNLHRRLVIEAGKLGARLLRGDATTVFFVGDGGGGFTPKASSKDRLLQVGAQYRFYDAGAQAWEVYDADGRLLEIKSSTGPSTTFVYSDASTSVATAPAPGYLISVSDHFGRRIALEYVLPAGADPLTDGRVSKITDASGRSTTFEYTNGNLTKVVWPDFSFRTFLYENTNFPWALTGVVDERQRRLSTFGYDALGRAISTERAGNTQRYAVTYGSAPVVQVADAYDAAANVVRRTLSWQPPTGTQVSLPNGTTSDMVVTSVGGTPYVTSQSQPAGAGCNAASKAMTYDANGNLTSMDDFNGSRTCNVYDQTRNLQTVQVEGLAGGASGVNCASVVGAGAALPSGARKSSKQWHPDWPLQTKLAEPGRVTTSVYNGQPDPFANGAIASCAPTAAILPDGKPIAVLCKKVEQATTDPNGASGMGAGLQAGVPARVWQWTYNAWGQVLTSVDPRGAMTAYAYYADTSADHTTGDLQTVTNALGHVTRYTKYDAAGRLLEQVNASSAKSSTTYTPRGLVHTVTVSGTDGTSGQTTTHTYDAAGLLSQTLLPDGTTLQYTYDDAQRLIETTDGAGNKVTYTLDSMGNRVAETIKDASGSLVRNITRVLDALGRLQQVTGAAQ